MTISYVGAGAFGSGTTAASSAYPSGSSTDLILAFIGQKPYDTQPTTTAPYAWLHSMNSGATANAADAGSVRATAFARNSSPTTAGSDSFSVTSGSPAMAQGLRFASTTGTWFPEAVALRDTTSTGTTVSATGATRPGQFASGDWIVVHAVANSDAETHTSQSVTIAGCTVGAVTWLSKVSTTSGNDAAAYVGYAQITAGSSTGDATYSATSSVSGQSNTAVNLVRLRDTAPSVPSGASIRSTTLGAETGATNVTTGRPWGLVAGDYLIAVHNSDADGDLASMTAPSGFTLLGSHTGDAATNKPFCKIWGKVADSTDESTVSYTFPDSTNAIASVVMFAVRQGTYDSATPTAGLTWNSVSAPATGNVDAPSITGAVDALLVCSFLPDNGGTGKNFSGGPSGMTQVGIATRGNTYAIAGVWSLLLTSTAATGTKTATLSAAPEGYAAASFRVNAASAATAVTLGDTAAATDSLTVTTAGTVTDTSTTSDALSAAVAASLSDARTATDALALTAAAGLTDAATGTDDLTVARAAALLDTGAASDAVTVTATTALGEPAAAGDTLTSAATTTVTDTATATESLQVTTTRTLPDTATAADALTATTTTSLSDTATAGDALTATTVLALSDTASGADALQVAAGSAPQLSETAATIDALTVTTTLTVTATATATDALSIGTPKAVADTATAADALAAMAALTVTDAATTADLLAVGTSPALTDSAAVAEAFAVIVTTSLADVAAAAEAILAGQLTAAPLVREPNLHVEPNQAALQVQANQATLHVEPNTAHLAVEPNRAELDVTPNLATLTL